MQTEPSTPLKFQSVVELGGKTATGIRVPPEIVQALGKGQRPPVLITIGGHTYRTTVAAYSGAYFVPLSAENRALAGVAAGDAIEVTVALDTQPREVELPADFAEALSADEQASRFFESLSYSNKRRWVLSIEDAKTPETRQRRITGAVNKLRDGKAM